MAELEEAELAVEAARRTGLPVVACVVFDSGAHHDRTMMGVTPEQAAQRLTAAGADVVGANCGQGIAGYVDICRRMRSATDRPLWIKANAGIPEIVDGQVVYRTSPAIRLLRSGLAGGRSPIRRRLLRHIARLHRRPVPGDSLMKSRERVLRAIHHQAADRVPIDVGGTRQSGIAASTYHQLKQRLGLHTPTRVFDLYQMLAEVELPVIERFGGDVIGLYRPDVAFGIINEDWRPWTMFDGTRSRSSRRIPAAARAGRQSDHRAAGRADCPHAARRLLLRSPGKIPGGGSRRPGWLPTALADPRQCEHFRAQSKFLYDNTDFAIVAPLGPPYELFYGLGTGDFENWMMTLACEPDYVHRLYDAWSPRGSRI